MPSSATPPKRLAVLDGLRRKLACSEKLSGSNFLRGGSAGSPLLDRLLPHAGLRRGSLAEYLADDFCGAAALALTAARNACRDGQVLVVVDRQKQFYPLAAVAWGIDLAQTVVLHPSDAAEELWALDQALRCPGVGAVWAWCGRLDLRDFRRLQLAAECGGTLGLLLRPAQVRREPSWADVRWLVEPLPGEGAWRLKVELLRCRGTSGGQAVCLELDESTCTWEEARDQHAAHPLSPFAELAGPAAARRSSRA